MPDQTADKLIIETEIIEAETPPCRAGARLRAGDGPRIDHLVRGRLLPLALAEMRTEFEKWSSFGIVADVDTL